MNYIEITNHFWQLYRSLTDGSTCTIFLPPKKPATLLVQDNLAQSSAQRRQEHEANSSIRLPFIMVNTLNVKSGM